MDIPVLPVNGSALDLEGDALRLCDIYWLDIRSVSSLCLNACWVVIVGLGLVDGSADVGDVDVDDLLLVRVENGAEIEGEGVLAVVHMRSVIHKCLLQSNIAAKSVIVANCPSYCGQQCPGFAISRNLRSQ